jgi:tetratricopeptide (TPR) repeat protein
VNVFLLFILVQVFIVLFLQVKYFLKTRDRLAIIPLFFQFLVLPVGMMSLFKGTSSSAIMEVLMILMGIILPLGFLVFDKPLLKRRVLLPNKMFGKNQASAPEKKFSEIASIIPEKEPTLVFSNVSSKDVLKSIENRIQTAHKAILDLDFLKALNIYQSLEGIFENRYYYFNYANLLFRNGEFEKANQAYEKVLGFFTKNVDVTKNKNSRTSNTMNRKLKREEVMYNIANAQYMRGRYCDAMSYYEKVIELDHNFKGGIDNYIEALLKMKNFDKAVSCCNTMVEKEHGYRYHYLLAKIYFELNDTHKCIEQLHKALGIDEAHVESLALLGEVYSSSEKFVEAVEVYKKLIKLTPQDYRVHYSLGKLLVSLEDYDAALESFSFAHGLNSNMFEALYNVALMYERKGQIFQAVDVYQKVIRLKPDFLGAYTRLWTLYSKENRFADVVEIFEKGVLNFPKEYVLHFYLGVAYSKLARYPEALDAFKNVMDINPEMKGINFYLGIILTKLEKYEEAIQTFRNALLDTPDDNEVFYNMSITYCMQERYDRAMLTLKKALELNPSLKEKIQENEVFHTLRTYEEFKRLAC